MKEKARARSGSRRPHAYPKMITIERILCPVDLSSGSIEALRYAVALARAYEAKLYLCHCIESPPGKNSVLSASEKEKINARFASSVIEHLGHADFAAIDWEGIIVEDDESAAVGITREAARRKVDLIVMRSRHRPHAAALLGSTAEALCRIAPCPVLVTHPREREWVVSSTGEIDLKRLLVAYDFSDGSERALTTALVIAQEYQAEIHLLHVLPKPSHDEPEIASQPIVLENLYQQAERRLRTAVTGETQLWCKVEAVVRWGKPYQEILAYASRHEIDLVCMGASGKNFGAGALFGSNVDRVLRQSPCPVLVARPLKPSFSVID